jgi:deoxyadenosine/deoxycytidine kinase
MPHPQLYQQSAILQAIPSNNKTIPRQWDGTAESHFVHLPRPRIPRQWECTRLVGVVDAVVDSAVARDASQVPRTFFPQSVSCSRVVLFCDHQLHMLTKLKNFRPCKMSANGVRAEVTNGKVATGTLFPTSKEKCGFASTTRYDNLDVFWVSVEGPIGAGKTTLMNRLQDSLSMRYGHGNVVLLEENIDSLMDSGLFQKYQKDPKRWAYLFQTKMFDLRTDEFLNTLEKLKRAFVEPWIPLLAPHFADTQRVIIITERSIMSGEVFMNVQQRQGNVDPTEYDTYMAMHAKWKRLYPVHPSLVIYCTPGKESAQIVDVCQDRIRERARDAEEELVTRAYNTILLEEHERMFGGGAFPVPVMRMDTTENYKTDERIALKKSGEVLEAIKVHWK